MPRRALIAAAGPLLALGLAGGGCEPAWATGVRFRPLAADGDAALAVTVAVRLVDVNGRPVIGLRSIDGHPVTTYAEQTIPPEGPPWVADLTPQSQIDRPDAAPTAYEVELRGDHWRQVYRFTLPDSAEILELPALLGVSAP